MNMVVRVWLNDPKIILPYFESFGHCLVNKSFSKPYLLLEQTAHHAFLSHHIRIDFHKRRICLDFNDLGHDIENPDENAK